MISSSCSYASSALAKTAVRRSADFTAATVFMVAAPDLVVELGTVWLLVGWPFALAEFVGGSWNPVRPKTIVQKGFRLNCTCILNVLALIAFAVVYRRYRHRDTSGTQRYAKDPWAGCRSRRNTRPRLDRRRRAVLVLLGSLPGSLRDQPHRW